MNIKNYYLKEFSSDELGVEINETATFDGLFDALKLGDIYQYIGVYDSVVRERLFEKLSELKETTYSEIYSIWLEYDQF
jgi:hypothetical protein